MRGISLGIGLTNACDLRCAHCYRPQGPPTHLGLEQVRRALDLFEVASVNLGTGENILNPELPAVLDLLHERGVRTSLTSNGLSLLRLDVARLRRLHDVEISIDFALEAEMDAFRGEGALRRALDAIERCKGLDLELTVLAVLMNGNWDRLAAVAELAGSLGANFRVNAYQPVHGHEFSPSPEQFWGAYELLFASGALLTCTEPVVVAALGMPGRAGGCGCGRTSVRLTPSGELLPCVYWPESAARLADLGDAAMLFESAPFQACRSLPSACGACDLLASCGGGCPARRALVGRLDEPDPYCPLAAGERRVLVAEHGDEVELLHAANVCTTIVRV